MPGSSSTKAPKFSRCVTLPLWRVPGAYFSLASAQGSSISAFLLSQIFPLSSILVILTSIWSPGLNSSAIRARGSWLASETWTRPSRFSASGRATNAPQSTTVRTVPFIT